MSDIRSRKLAATQCNATLELADLNARSESEEKDRVARLVRTIEGEIVPRLLLSLSGSLTAAQATIEQHEATLFALRLSELYERYNPRGF